MHIYLYIIYKNNNNIKNKTRNGVSAIADRSTSTTSTSTNDDSTNKSERVEMRIWTPAQATIRDQAQIRWAAQGPIREGSSRTSVLFIKIRFALFFLLCFIDFTNQAVLIRFYALVGPFRPHRRELTHCIILCSIDVFDEPVGES